MTLSDTVEALQKKTDQMDNEFQRQLEMGEKLREQMEAAGIKLQKQGFRIPLEDRARVHFAHKGG